MLSTPAHSGTAGELLELWERAVAAGPADRPDVLLAALGAPPSSLGARNAALLQLRARLFGPAQPLSSRCPRCGTTTEFAIDCSVLAQALLPAPDADAPHRLDALGHHIEFRLPTATDVRAAAAEPDGDFVQALLARCIERCERDDGGACDVADIPDAVAELLSERMESLEPGATVGFDLTCPECASPWTAAMDCGGILWSELQARAERLLLDVDALARAYGWSEPQVLALSATRRAAYLQLVGGAA
jgi:hypothetical protein